jgi:hypothetical protein
LLLQIIISQPQTKSGSLSSTLTLPGLNIATKRPRGHVFGEGEGTSAGAGSSWPGRGGAGWKRGERLKARLTTRGKRGVGVVNRHPTVHQEGWIEGGQETVICWVPVVS